eukprot:8028903-Lingulodinium_polyedra.AAC.1
MKQDEEQCVTVEFPDTTKQRNVSLLVFVLLFENNNAQDDRAAQLLQHDDSGEDEVRASDAR